MNRRVLNTTAAQIEFSFQTHSSNETRAEGNFSTGSAHVHPSAAGSKSYVSNLYLVCMKTDGPSHMGRISSSAGGRHHVQHETKPRREMRRSSLIGLKLNLLTKSGLLHVQLGDALSVSAESIQLTCGGWARQLCALNTCTNDTGWYWWHNWERADDCSAY